MLARLRGVSKRRRGARSAIGRRRSFVAGLPVEELVEEDALAIHLRELVVSADEVAVDEDLRDARPARLRAERATTAFDRAHVELAKRNASLGEELLCANAVEAEGRGVDDDVGGHETVGLLASWSVAKE